MEEQRLDTQVTLICKIFGLITCESAYISQKADARLLWIAAGIDLARMESRERWGRSCRRIGRSAGARWEGADQLKCNELFWNMHTASSWIMHAHGKWVMDDYLTTLPDRLCAWVKCVRQSVPVSENAHIWNKKIILLTPWWRVPIPCCPPDVGWSPPRWWRRTRGGCKEIIFPSCF